jgi:hypothetical protein
MRSCRAGSTPTFRHDAVLRPDGSLVGFLQSTGSVKVKAVNVKPMPGDAVMADGPVETPLIRYGTDIDDARNTDSLTKKWMLSK